MVCDVCGAKDPEINIQQVIGDKKRSIHLCRKCANEQGIIKNNDTLEFSLSKLVNFYLELDSKKKNPVCPVCGKSLQDLKKTKKIGCEDCILYFNRYISRALGINKKSAQSHIYKGKIPRRMKIVKDVLFDLESLKKQLKKAIDNEEYEKAAIIRDKINHISMGAKND